MNNCDMIYYETYCEYIYEYFMELDVALNGRHSKFYDCVNADEIYYDKKNAASKMKVLVYGIEQHFSRALDYTITNPTYACALSNAQYVKGMGDDAFDELFKSVKMKRIKYLYDFAAMCGMDIYDDLLLRHAVIENDLEVFKYLHEVAGGRALSFFASTRSLEDIEYICKYAILNNYVLDVQIAIAKAAELSKHDIVAYLREYSGV